MSKQRGTFTNILEISAQYPALEYSQIATMLKLHPNTVKSIMSSDAFRDKRARLVAEMHSNKMVGVQGQLFDTGLAVLEAVQNRLETAPELISDASLLKLAEFFIPYTAQKMDTGQPEPGTNNNVNVIIGQDALADAKRRIEEKGRAIELPTTTRPQAIAKKRD